MKAITSPESSRLAAQTLKVVAITLILISLLDFVTLLFPFKPLDRNWQIGFATQVVDRGIIPLVGIALLVTGYWIDNIASDHLADRSSGLSLKFWALLLSSLLGLLFLLLFPLHINNAIQGRAEAVERINQDANQARTQLQNQLGNPQAQAELERQQSLFRDQIGVLLQNEQQLNQALGSEQVPEQFKNLIRQAKANPQSLEQLLQRQFNLETLRTQGQTQIQTRQSEATQLAEQDAWKSGVRVGISSLLLSVGYIVLGWTGLKSTGKTRLS